MAASIQRFYITRGDAAPVLEAIVTKESDNLPYNFSNVSSLHFSMTKRGETLAKVTASATVSSATGGVIQYAWVAGDTNEAGTYDGQFHAVDTGGKLVSFPNGGWIEIHVVDRK